MSDIVKQILRDLINGPATVKERLSWMRFHYETDVKFGTAREIDLASINFIERYGVRDE